ALSVLRSDRGWTWGRSHPRGKSRDEGARIHLLRAQAVAAIGHLVDRSGVTTLFFSTEFRARLAGEQRFDRSLRRQVLVEDAIHRLADRHRDAERGGELSDILRGGDAFGDMAQLGEDGR